MYATSEAVSGTGAGPFRTIEKVRPVRSIEARAIREDEKKQTSRKRCRCVRFGS